MPTKNRCQEYRPGEERESGEAEAFKGHLDTGGPTGRRGQDLLSRGRFLS
jgi:hypothetical protein